MAFQDNILLFSSSQGKEVPLDCELLYMVLPVFPPLQKYCSFDFCTHCGVKLVLLGASIDPCKLGNFTKLCKSLSYLIAVLCFNACAFFLVYSDSLTNVESMALLTKLSPFSLFLVWLIALPSVYNSDMLFTPSPSCM